MTARHIATRWSNADWWARVAQARTKHDDLMPKRMWTAPLKSYSRGPLRCGAGTRASFAVIVVVAVVGLLIGAAGCSGHPPYPQTWPSLSHASHASCAELAGTYTNKGERAQGTDLGPISMVEMLFPQTGMHSADTVTLSYQHPDRLEIIIAEGSTATSRCLLLNRRSGQFTCEPGGIIIHENAQWEHGVASAPGGAVPVVGGSSVSFKLQLVEGFLIITKRDVDFLWLPIPGRTTWSSWYRFQRIVQ
jgi:hypothetical protein